MRMLLKPRVHRTILSLPLIGKTLQDENLARYFQGLSILLQNGVAPQDALKLAAQSSRNIFLSENLEKVAEQVVVGQSIPDGLSKTKLIDPEILSVLKIGDQVNKLPSVLMRASELIDTRSRRKMKRVMAIFTPTITIFMGLIVGTLAFTVMTALLSVNELAI